MSANRTKPVQEVIHHYRLDELQKVYFLIPTDLAREAAKKAGRTLPKTESNGHQRYDPDEPQELEQKSNEFGIHVSSVQWDYVIGWLLYAIFASMSLKDMLFLKGANALRKCYFGQTRYSADIDLGTPGAIDLGFLKSELLKACDLVAASTGIQFRNEQLRIQEHFKVTAYENKGRLKVFEVRIYFQEFYMRNFSPLVSYLQSDSL